MTTELSLGKRGPVSIRNKGGKSNIVLVCEHASNYIPNSLTRLGLSESSLTDHIAWDPGALAVAEIVSDMLDAPLVHATVSRLVIDLNREPGHPGSIVTCSEWTVIPGNEGLTAREREVRRELIYEPFHRALTDVVKARISSDPWVVSIHSFTPVYKGVSRTMDAGVLHDSDTRLSDCLLASLQSYPNLTIGDNEPYRPSDGVYHTIQLHTSTARLPGAMIEIRNDLIRHLSSQTQWALVLYNALLEARRTLEKKEN